MEMYVVVGLTALVASGLTFFSGFGLGTILLPVFALFFPVDQAIAMTAVVHFLNSLFKLALVGRKADGGVVLRFGLPAIAASFLGAFVLLWLADLSPVTRYQLAGREFVVTPIKLAIGLLLLVFASFEIVPRLRDLEFDRRYLPLGGVLSGFFGGLAGTQGALRSAFLIRAGLTKEAFIGTGVVIACLVDISRLTVYVPTITASRGELNVALLGIAVLAAFLGAVVGNAALKKLTIRALQAFVAIMLALIAIGMMAGIV